MTLISYGHNFIMCLGRISFVVCMYSIYFHCKNSYVSYVFHVLGLCEKCVLCILCVSRVNDVMYFV